MSWWNLQLKVGFVVFLSFILLGVLLFSATDSPWTTSGNLLTFHFDFVNDLRVGASVQLSGVQVGKVTKIELMEGADGVFVEARINSIYKNLRKNCKVKIGIIGFVGEAYIDLINSDRSNAPLTAADLPLKGETPAGVTGMMEVAGEAIASATELTKTTNEMFQPDNLKLAELIDDTRATMEQTNETLRLLAISTQQTSNDISSAVQKSMGKLETLIEQVTNDFTQFSIETQKVSRSAVALIDRNSEPIDEIIQEFKGSAENFHKLSLQLERDLRNIKSQMSELIASGQKTIEAETPKLDRLLGDFSETSTQFSELQEEAKNLLDRLQRGDGTVAKLINEPSTFNRAEQVLQNAGEAMVAVQDLSETLQRRSEQIRLPKFSWDYKLNYFATDRQLYNEISFLLLPRDERQRLRIGFDTFAEEVKFELQYGYDFTRYFSGRAGFIRSKPAIGFDLKLFNRKFWTSLEATEITGKNPKFAGEFSFQFLPNAHLTIGMSHLAGNRNYIGGVKLTGKNWR